MSQTNSLHIKVIKKREGTTGEERTRQSAACIWRHHGKVPSSGAKYMEKEELSQKEPEAAYKKKLQTCSERPIRM